MINVNLLPPDLRPKKKNLSKFIFGNFNFIIFSVLGSILILNGIFFLLIFTKNLHYSALNKKWQANKNDFERLENWKKENQKLTQEYQQLSKLIQQKISVYQKLKALSKSIPDGLWFRHLSLGIKEIKIEGSIVSLGTPPMSIFRLFCDNLKKDNEFFKDVAGFEIGVFKNRKIAGYEILDFVMAVRLK